MARRQLQRRSLLTFEQQTIGRHIMKHGTAFLSLAMLAGALGMASAQQTVSLEQAWHQCLVEVRTTAGTNPDNDGQRTAAFKACMARLGHAGGR
jgi:hypothetical protein